jgi:hypothetical protein
MVDSASRYELGFAVLAGVTAVAGSYAVAGYTRSFVVAPIDALVVNLTPGPIVTFMIENVGDAGHLLHIALSVGIAVGLFGVLSLAGRRITGRLDSVAAGSTIAGVSGWGLAAAITGEVILAAGAAIPVAVFTAASHLGRPDGTHDPDRRRVLGTVAGGILFAGTAVGIGSVFSEDTPLADAPGTEDVEARLDEGDRKSLDVAGDLPGLVSSIDGFYNVDIAEFDPELTAEDWSLTFTGAVTGDEMTVTYDDLVDMPREDRFVTLRCVGERLNGKKLDTAVWTGTPIAPLLEEVDPDGECGCVMLHGDDGYFVQYPVEVLENGFLAWGMNGKELPPAHGHPVRVLIPGHWGETNVKWLTKIELLDEEMDGYWEQRGWQGTGTVKTVAKLWDEGISKLDDGRTELAGHAYAGTRGISRVEVSTDGGESWNDATLSERLPDEDVWRQWRYTFEPSGTHDVVVRAIDDDGNVQTQSESDPSPTGASGWVRRTVSA